MLARIAAGFSAQLVSVLLSVADRIVLVGVLVHVWGADTYADWTVIASAAGLISLGELGLNVYFGNVFQQAWTRGDAPAFRRAVQVSIFASGSLALALAMLAVTTAVVLDVPAGLSLRTLPPAEALAITVLLGAAAISSVLRGNISQVYRGHGEFGRGIVMSAVPVAAFLLAAIPAALHGASPVVLAVLLLACDAGFGTVLMGLDVRRRYADLLVVPAWPTRAEIQDLLAHVRWFAVLQGAPVAWLHVPVLLLGGLTHDGAVIVGFVVMRTLVNFARMLGAMLALAVGVELAPTLHARTRTDLLPALEPVGIVLGALNGGLAAGLVIFGSALVVPWTGEASLFDPTVIALLLAASAVATPALPLATVLMYANVPRPVAIAGLAQLGAGLAAAAILTQGFGAAGTAAGLAIGEALGLGLVLPLLARPYLGVRWSRYFAACAFAWAVSATWCGIAAFAAGWLFNTESWLGLIAALVLWSLAGLAPALTVSLPRPQRGRIANAVSQRLQR